MATRLIALALLAFSLLPVANLVPGGEEDLAYAERMLDWLNGLALCLGVGLLAAYVARVRVPTRPVLNPESSGNEPARGPGGTAGWAFVLIAALSSLLLYAVMARLVFSGKPLLIDEIVQVIQARWYAEGQLWMPAPPVKEFFSIMHMVDLGDRVFGQFPAGGPAMLALGSLVGAEWVVGPVVGAVSVALFAVLLPTFEPGATRRWVRGTTLLFALTPFGAFTFASHMNHATTLMWLLVAMAGLVRATESDTSSPWWGLLTGLGLGVAATIRPLDALAFALPAAGWLLWRARRGGKPLGALLLSGVGVAVPVAILLYVNSETTGAPLLFGYDQLWGSGHAIGFHQPPWGPPHTPARGLELISIYFTRLSTYLYELPFPAMLLVAGGLWFTRRLSALDRYLLAASGLVVLGYWAYWHDGFFLGPRFYFGLLPALVLWTARLPLRLRPLVGRDSLAWIGFRTAAAVGLLMVLVALVFIRVPSYRNGLTSMRLDVERVSAAAGVRDAVVLVQESWGARLIVRMWARGIPHPTTEHIYRNVDACQLELTLAELERDLISGPEAQRRLEPLLADSALIDRSTRALGLEAIVPGRENPAECTRLRDLDRGGTSHLAPFLLARDGNLYARWLPGREAEVAALHPGRAVYRLRRTGPAPDAGVVWEPIAIGDR
jgi:hypothetical protein